MDSSEEHFLRPVLEKKADTASPVSSSPDVDVLLRGLWDSMRAYSIALAGGDILFAEEILQEGAIRIWEQRAMLPEIRNVRAWAFRILYFKAHVLRRKRSENPAIGFSGEIMELIAGAAEKNAEAGKDDLLQKLLSCVSQLKDDERALLSGHYEECISLKEIAERAGKNEDAVYKQVSRLRRFLRRCVEKKSSGE